MDYSIFNNYMVRTPLRSLKDLEDFLGEVDFEKGKRHLFEFFKIPVIQEALFLASTDLYFRLMDYYNQKISSQKDIDKLTISLLKYYTRISTRSTPFGLFATCFLGSFSDQTEFKIESGEQSFLRRTRIDMRIVWDLITKLDKQHTLRNVLTYFPNSNILRQGDQIKYVEFSDQHGQRQYVLSAIDSSPYLEKILEMTIHGSPYGALIDYLISEEIDQEDAEEFIHELIDNQVIISNLYPVICGYGAWEQVIDVLKTFDPELNVIVEGQKWTIGKVVDWMTNIKNEMAEIDDRNLTQTFPHHYQHIRERLSELGYNLNSKELFQVDAFRKPKKSFLDEKLKDQILGAINILNIISSKKAYNPNLESFKATFSSRYETQEISLLQVLDNDTGIGYPVRGSEIGGINPLINAFEHLQPAHVKNTATQPRDDSWNPIQYLFIRKIVDSVKEDKTSITLTDQDFLDMKPNWDDLPDTFSCLTNIIEQEGVNKILFFDVGGFSATNVLSRFCHLDKSINDYVDEIANFEDQIVTDDCVVTELIYLPNSKAGNIAHRPLFRKFEIPLLTKPTLSETNSIGLSDLYVSVKDNEVILRSRKLNKRVIVKNSCAHNFSYNTLAAYHFLSDLQTQSKRGNLSFDWGNVANIFKFLPRVNYGECILSPATWQFSYADYSMLLQIKNDTLLASVREWRNIFKLPRFINFIDGDNKLFIDLENYLLLQVMLSILKKKNSVKVTEYLNSNDNAIVRDYQGLGYANEVVFGVYKNKRASVRIAQPVANSRGSNTSKQTRIFSPGSEWLYFKVYLGSKTSDKFLTEVLDPIIEVLLQKNLIQKWFFIRYKDPDYHVRIRFHLRQESDIGSVTQLFSNSCANYLDVGLIANIQISTYEREIERYGQNTIQLAEQIFFADSKMILSVLKELRHTKAENYRWMIAIKAIDQTFEDLNITLNERTDIVGIFAENFQKEFGGGKALSVNLATTYRAVKSFIAQVMQENTKEHELNVYKRIIEDKSVVTKQYYNQLLTIRSKGELQVNFTDLIGSYIHMMINRLFKSKQRTYEMVLYYALWNHYKSQLAILNRKQTVS